MSIFKKAVPTSFFLICFLQFLIFSMPKIETLKKFILERSEHFRQQIGNANFSNWPPFAVFNKKYSRKRYQEIGLFLNRLLPPTLPTFHTRISKCGKGQTLKYFGSSVCEVFISNPNIMTKFESFHINSKYLQKLLQNLVFLSILFQKSFRRQSKYFWILIELDN